MNFRFFFRRSSSLGLLSLLVTWLALPVSWIFDVFRKILASWTVVPVWLLGWLCQFPGFFFEDQGHYLVLLAKKSKLLPSESYYKETWQDLWETNCPWFEVVEGDLWGSLPSVLLFAVAKERALSMQLSTNDRQTTTCHRVTCWWKKKTQPALKMSSSCELLFRAKWMILGKSGSRIMANRIREPGSIERARFFRRFFSFFLSFSVSASFHLLTWKVQGAGSEVKQTSVHWSLNFWDLMNHPLVSAPPWMFASRELSANWSVLAFFWIPPFADLITLWDAPENHHKLWKLVQMTGWLDDGQ